MRLSVQKLSEHFEIPTDAVHSIVNAVMSTPQASESQQFVLVPEQRELLLLALALHGAQCRQCGMEFQYYAINCKCNRKVGRCPTCQRYTSFSIAEKCYLGRDEYTCDLCGTRVVSCKASLHKYCFRWTAKYGDAWPDNCPECQSDPIRIADDREKERRRLDMAEEFGRNIAASLLAQKQTNRYSERED